MVSAVLVVITAPVSVVRDSAPENKLAAPSLGCVLADSFETATLLDSLFFRALVLQAHSKRCRGSSAAAGQPP